MKEIKLSLKERVWLIEIVREELREMLDIAPDEDIKDIFELYFKLKK